MLYYLSPSPPFWPSPGPLRRAAVTLHCRRVSFVLGTLILFVLSRFAGDPAWDVGVSLIMATACYLTAPAGVRDLLVRRRVTLRSLVFWLGSTSATFHLYQWARSGNPHLDWFVGNLAGSSLLYVCCGVLWNVDPREHWLPVGAVASIGLLALWSWS